MLKTGTQAPDFEAVQHDGEKFCFADWRGDSAVVLYFVLYFPEKLYRRLKPSGPWLP